MSHPTPAMDWTERNIAIGGQAIRRTKFPGMVGPLEWMHTHKGHTTILMGGAQGFKTIMACSCAAHRIATAQGPLGYYIDTENTMEDVASQKVFPIIDCCSSSHVLRTGQTTASRDYPRGIVKMYSANRDGDRQQKSLRYVVCDEAHLWRKGQLSEVLNRMTGFADIGECLIATTGGESPSELSELCDAATMYQFSPPCDKCGVPMSYEFFSNPPEPFDETQHHAARGVIVEKDGMRMFRAFGGLNFDATAKTEDDIAESLHYECPTCGHQHRWSPATRDARNLAALKQHDGNDLWHGYKRMRIGSSSMTLFHYSPLYHMDWRTLGLSWLRATRLRQRGDDSAAKAFYQTKLGKNYHKWVFVKDLDRQQKRVSGGYRMVDPSGPVDVKAWWPDAQLVIGTVDVGKDHCWVVFRAWAMIDGYLFSRLLWAGMVLSKNTLRQMQLNIGVPDYGKHGVHRSPDGRLYLPGDGCGMFIDGNYDLAGNVRQMAIEYSWVIYRGRDRLNKPIHREFRHGDGQMRIFSDIELVSHVMPGKVDAVAAQIQFASRRCEDILWNMRQVSTSGSPIWTYADDVPDDYISHLGARIRDDAGNWVDVSRADHLLDCEKMQIGVLATRKLVGVDAGE